MPYRINAGVSITSFIGGIANADVGVNVQDSWASAWPCWHWIEGKVVGIVPTYEDQRITNIQCLAVRL